MSVLYILGHEKIFHGEKVSTVYYYIGYYIFIFQAKNGSQKLTAHIRSGKGCKGSLNFLMICPYMVKKTLYQRELSLLKAFFPV